MPNYGYTHNELRNNPEYQRLKQELGEAQELMNAYNCALLEVKSKLDPRFFSDEIVLDDPYWIFDMLQDDCNAKFEINHIEGNRYKIKVIRPKKDHIGKALIVSPNLGCIMLARSFETEFITDEPIIYECKDKSNMYVNNIVDSYDNEFCFCNGDVEIFKIKNARFILKKDDFIKK